MDAGAIEMSSKARSSFRDDPSDDEDDAIDDFVDDEIILEPKEPFEWADSQVKRQNRCFIVSMTTFFLALLVYVVGGIYSTEDSALEGEIYDAKQGIVSDGFAGSKAQQKYEKLQGERPSHGAHDWWESHGKDNPFGNKNVVVDNGALNTGSLRHKDTTKKKNTVATVESSQQNSYNLCDHSVHSDWLKAKVTKADGVKYEVLERLDHDHKAFVQGLTFADGTLWESNGLYGRSTVRILNSTTADVIKSVNLDKHLFGEGMAYRDGKLYQITWKSKRGFIYDAVTLDLVREFSYKTTLGEGWGITWDPCDDEFIVTDGSPNLHFWDVNTLQQTRKIAVTRMDGNPAEELNEIEWYRGRILANVWYEDVLLVINPVTGVVEKEYDFRDLFPKPQRKRLNCDVFNGISVSDDPDVLYVTGKKWDRMFKVRLLT